MTAGSLALLYSGGKDSTLAALLLEGFYDLTLVTAHFGVTDDWEHAEAAAERIGHPFERVKMDRDVADDAVAQLREDGFPRNAIQSVHEHALECVAELGVDGIADGTRRDDRVPTISRAHAQSLEDRHDVDYVAPLSGFGRGAVDELVDATIEVTVGPSEKIQRADYEGELRALLADEDDGEAVESVFPDHDQTIVTGVKRTSGSRTDG